MWQRLREYGKRHDRLLVVEYDAYRLVASILRAAGPRIVVEAAADSRDADPAQALAEAVGRLDAPRLPRQAILLIPNALLTVVRPAFDPDTASHQAVLETIQLELEARLSEQIGTRPLEEIFVERGYLSEEAARAVRREMETGTAPAGAAGRGLFQPGQKFAEVALAMQQIDRAAWQECQMIHERISFEQMNDSDVDWAAVPMPRTPARPQPAWLTAAVRSAVRDQWIAEFDKLSVELAAIYPLVGCAAAAFDQYQRVATAAVVEVRPGLIGISQFSRGQLTDVQLRYPTGQATSAEMIAELVPGGVDIVWLAAAADRWPALGEDLAGRLGVEVRPLAVAARDGDSDDADPQLPVSACGAWRHRLGWSTELVTHCVSTADAGRRVRQRPWVSVAAALLAMAGLLGAVDAYHAWHLIRSRQSLTAAQAEVNKHQQDLRRITRTNLRVVELEQEVAALDDELARVARHIEFVDRDLPRRRDLPLALLNAVARAASPEVAVDAIEDRDWRTVHVAGWALSQVAAERFADALSSGLRPWHLELIEAPVIEQGKGRLDLDGYRFDLRFGTRTDGPRDEDTPGEGDVMVGAEENTT